MESTEQSTQQMFQWPKTLTAWYWITALTLLFYLGLATYLMDFRGVPALLVLVGAAILGILLGRTFVTRYEHAVRTQKPKDAIMVLRTEAKQEWILVISFAVGAGIIYLTIHPRLGDTIVVLYSFLLTIGITNALGKSRLAKCEASA